MRGGRPILRKQRGESKRICDIQLDFFNVTVAKTIALYITVAMYCRLFRVSDSGSDPLLVD